MRAQVAGLHRLLSSFRIQCLTPPPTRSGYDSYGAVGVTGTPPFNGTALAEPFVDAGRALGAFVAARAAAARGAGKQKMTRKRAKKKR